MSSASGASCSAPSWAAAGGETRATPLPGYTGPAVGPVRGSDDGALTGVIDRQRLEAVGEPGSDFLVRMIDRFLGELPGLEIELRRAAEAGDRGEVRRLAHVLRGRAAMLGAMELAAACAALEAGDGSLADVEARCAEAERELRVFRQPLPASPVVAASRGPRRIMLVDDDPLQRAVTAEALARIDGCSVHQCDSAEQALSEVADLEPEVVLMDLRLPGMDGVEAIERLRAAMDGLIVLALTASLDPAEHDRARAAGATDVLAKPYDLRDLTERVSAAWRRGSST